MFLIINDSHLDKGQYVFNGEPVISRTTSLLYSKEELSNILDQIDRYTTKQRDYLITLENEKGERVYAMDNIGLEDIEELEAKGVSAERIEALNYFTVLSEGEPPIA